MLLGFGVKGFQSRGTREKVQCFLFIAVLAGFG